MTRNTLTQPAAAGAKSAAVPARTDPTVRENHRLRHTIITLRGELKDARAEVERLQAQAAGAWETYREHNTANHMEPPGSWERLAWEQKAHWQELAMLAILRELQSP